MCSPFAAWFPAWDRNTARAAVGGEFPNHAPFRYVQRVPSSTIPHVSVSPPFHPARPDFPGTVGDPDFPQWTFPLLPKLKGRLPYTPSNSGLPKGSKHYGGNRLNRLKVPGRAVLVSVRCREPLCPQQVLPLGAWCLVHHVGRYYPSFIAHTGSWARANTSRRLRLSLVQRIFADCRQSLLVEMSLPGVISAILV